MWIKICANTNLPDALLAAELGASAVGFVFARSSREVSAAEVAAITPHLPPGVQRVGVFDTHKAQEIASAVRLAALDSVQLHGRLDLPLIRELRDLLGPEITLIQALHWSVDTEAKSQAVQIADQIGELRSEPSVRHILIDSRIGAATGGTGRSFDWNAAADLLAGSFEGLHLIVAGGLSPENVARATDALQPWGVDVASGIELSPGKKDRQKLEAFLRNARGGTARNASM